MRDPDKLKKRGLCAEIVKGDITVPKTLTGTADGVDCVLNLATLGHMNNYTVTEEMFFRINRDGALNVMKEALRAKAPRVVHASTVAAMGICRENPADETAVCNPHHPYGRSKLEAEKAVLKMVHEEGLPAVIVRFSMVYGPGDPRDMLKLARLARKGLFPKVGLKPKLTPLIHVEDACDALFLAAEKGRTGEVYLITNEHPEPFDRIRKYLLKGLGIWRPPFFVPEWAALMGAMVLETGFTLMGKTPPVARKNIESTLADRVFSTEKAARDMGFKTRIQAEQGIIETVKWYMEKGWV